MGKSFGVLWHDRFGTEAPAGATNDPHPAIANLLAHRTHRRYAEDPIDEATLALLLAATLSAPSKSDLQQVSVIRIPDPKTRAAIAELIPSMPWIANAPEFFIFCGDNRRIRRICKMRGLKYANNTMDAVFNATIDAAIAMQTMICAAEIMGLGTCPISHVRDHVDTVADILAIPEGVFPISGLCLGHPGQEGFISLRLPPEASVHTNLYDDAGLEAEIDGYDRRRDARYSIPAEKYKYTEEFGTPDFYGWSADKARQMAVNDGQTMRTYLAAKGFTMA